MIPHPTLKNYGNGNQIFVTWKAELFLKWPAPRKKLEEAGRRGGAALWHVVTMTNLDLAGPIFPGLNPTAAGTYFILCKGLVLKEVDTKPFHLT